MTREHKNIQDWNHFNIKILRFFSPSSVPPYLYYKRKNKQYAFLNYSNCIYSFSF